MLRAALPIIASLVIQETSHYMREMLVGKCVISCPINIVLFVLPAPKIVCQIERRMFMLMALKRNQKGLTLIELLAVLVIVGIIAAIAIPAIGGTIAKSKEKADTASEQLIKDAALRYMVDHQDDTTPPTTVDVTTLVTEGYLNATPTFNNKKNTVAIAVTAANNTWTFTITRT